jgi:hypothetical protein
VYERERERERVQEQEQNLAYSTMRKRINGTQ